MPDPTFSTRPNTAMGSTRRHDRARHPVGEGGGDGKADAAAGLGRRGLLAGALGGLLGGLPSGPFANVPSWGARTSRSADTPVGALAPGEWVWGLAGDARGPLVLLVGLAEQLAYVYRNGLLAAVSTVSTGRPGHATPTGVFTILQKDRDHRSSLYNAAPMPYQERLTWDGIALHAGGLPGYPESHGCVHLPTEFARRLFEVTRLGMTVVISREGTAASRVAGAPVIAPVRPDGREAPAPLPADASSDWSPERAPDGPVSLLLSTVDARLVVLRNGLEIGRTAVSLRPIDGWTGTHAFVRCDGYADGDFPAYPGGRAPAWLAMALPGHDADAGRPVSRDEIDDVVIPPEFASRVVPLLDVGTVLVVTPASIAPHTTGVPLRVVDAVRQA